MKRINLFIGVMLVLSVFTGCESNKQTNSSSSYNSEKSSQKLKRLLKKLLLLLIHRQQRFKQNQPQKSQLNHRQSHQLKHQRNRLQNHQLKSRSVNIEPILHMTSLQEHRMIIKMRILC